MPPTCSTTQVANSTELFLILRCLRFGLQLLSARTSAAFFAFHLAETRSPPWLFFLRSGLLEGLSPLGSVSWGIRTRREAGESQGGARGG